MLIDLYEHMTDLLYSFVHDFLAMQPSFQLEQGLHLNLLDAIQKQDQASAAMYVENDMEVLKDYILKMTEE